ncbi:hypothetical protein IscW_ISCW000703 [Ixodes scapularis]|uniref:Uncharacterized protein n=1 Tax=Ixodes scapularis TaxID=6945 RepID=B7P304_IXOSC|nr:hypothetical protein IscW_ISCW000703 [Ixodes scapularis]|eukprot:XP_002403252.1 hypothetical protein IscW_ISCW000703 [Ixodes scapularis]
MFFVLYNIWNCGHTRVKAMDGNVKRNKCFAPGCAVTNWRSAGGQRVAPFNCEDRFSPSRRILITQTAKDLLTCTRGLFFLIGANGSLERRHVPTASGEVIISALTGRDFVPPRRQREPHGRRVAARFVWSTSPRGERSPRAKEVLPVLPKNKLS